MLVRGYIFNDTVKAKQCADCKCKSEVLAANFNNPNLMLYGCKDTKCKNRILWLNFDSLASETNLSKLLEN